MSTSRWWRLLLPLLLLSACSSPPPDAPLKPEGIAEQTGVYSESPPRPDASSDRVLSINHYMLVTAATLPATLVEGKVAAGLATDATSYRELWALFRMDKQPPGIDWEQFAVLFVGTGESGSCPLYWEGLSFDAASMVLTTHMTELPPNAKIAPVCTADFRPRTFVIAIPKGQLPNDALRVRVQYGFSPPPEVIIDRN